MPVPDDADRLGPDVSQSDFPFMYPKDRKVRALKDMSLDQLEQLVARLEALVGNENIVDRLPDRGLKVKSRLEGARTRIEKAKKEKECARREEDKRIAVSAVKNAAGNDALTPEQASAQVDEMLASGMSGVSISGSGGQGLADASPTTRRRIPTKLDCVEDERERYGQFESMSSHRLHPRQGKVSIIMNAKQSMALAIQTQEAERKYKIARARAKLLTLAQDPAKRSAWVPSTLSFPVNSSAWRQVEEGGGSDEDEDGDCSTDGSDDEDDLDKAPDILRAGLEQGAPET